jgi:hypothetical protein
LVWLSLLEDYGPEQLRLALGAKFYHLHIAFLPIYLVAGMIFYLIGRERTRRLLAADDADKEITETRN